MKRFLIKFCILFVLIDGYIAIYQYYITPCLTGDMGRMGQIMFNKDYYKRIQQTYSSQKSYVIPIQQTDSIISDTNNSKPCIFTIGDSFSQQKEYGYAQYLGEQLSMEVYNFSRTPIDISAEQHLIKLLNRNELPKQSIVIVESVERIMVGRLCGLDFQDTAKMEFVVKEKEQPHVLNNAVQYITKSCGKQQPIHRYSLIADLFSHKNKTRQLYIYDSPWDNDGDFRFVERKNEDYDMAYTNLNALHAYSEAHGIHMLYMIAADKYEVYKPFIISGYRPNNPTLDKLPQEPWVINTKPLMRSLVAKGVQDVYYINDTHWSPIGAKVAGEEIANRLVELGFIQ